MTQVKGSYNSPNFLTEEALITVISNLKKDNKIIGLCVGAFDLLHPGHVAHFISAKKYCDVLVVGITSDKYVEKRKKRKPVFDEQMRAYSVSQIKTVDYVFISNYLTADKVIYLIKPNVFIKGPDYANKNTPGITSDRKAIKEVGGEIKYTTDQKLSSTEIIKHIQDHVKREKILLGIDRDGTLIEDVLYLGKDKNWRNQVVLKDDVLDFVMYIQTIYDTVKVVMSNQQGVARGYFDVATFKSVNDYIDDLLRKRGIIIDNWKFCPDVDATYADSMKDVKFVPEFVKEKSRRKPSQDMLMEALQELNKNIKNFDKIVIIGNNQDDAGLARNLKVKFIDVTGKNYSALKKEFDDI
tara:strand:+ start:12618 stop:13679 length:1062 start_codon:yes stop_codon:yes gene_type:complete